MVATPERRTHCIRIEPVDGDSIRIAIAYPVDLIMSNGAVYKGGIYSQPTGINSTLSGGGAVIDFGSVFDVDAITRDQLQSGYWDGASVYSFFTDWAYPVEDEEESRLFTFGKVNTEDGRFTVQLMGQIDKLNNNIGRIHSALCGYTFADYHIDVRMIATDKSRCKKNKDDYIESGTVTAVVSNNQFTVGGFSGLFVDDWFGNGEVRFTSGANAGLGYRIVKSYSSAGVITVNSPFFYEILAGDEIEIIAGCRKRFTEDCVGKYANGVNNGSFPHVPTQSSVSKFGNQT